ncbi:MAG: CPBP family intramembrane glutamic endopeptidase [Thermoguttaceae bacterium]
MGSTANETSSSSPKKRAGYALLILFTLLYPTALTWLYFVVCQGLNPNVLKLSYVVGKSIQFLFPVLFVAFVLKQRWLVRRFNFRGVLPGTIFGLAVALVIFFVGRHFIIHGGAFEPLVDKLSAELTMRLEGFGITSVGPYLLLFFFYSLCHSGLEEYYWRWFAFSRLAEKGTWLQAALLTNLAFMLHHIVLLGVYFGYGSLLTWLCSFGVAVGGFVWQWLYRKYDSIYGAWVSHGFIDAGIFALGFYMLP